MSNSPANSAPIILGIDPGYDRLGWAIGRSQRQTPEVLAYGCIQTKKINDLAQRYLSLEEQLTEIIEKWQPTQLAIETLYFARNKNTALKVSESRGVVLSCCARHQLEIFEYHPNTIKLTTTGHGKADKKAVEKMVRLQLKLKDEKIIDDAIDALAIVLTHTVTRH